MRRKAGRDLTIEEQLARGPIDLTFLTLVIILTVIGLIMLLSASYPSAYYNLDSSIDTGGNPYYYFNRQLVFAILGIIAMFVLSRINYQQFRWMSIVLLVIAFLLLLLVFTPMGRSGGGARRWISLFGLRFQPSEVAKIAVILFFAARLSKRKDRLKSPRKWDRRRLTGRICSWLDRVGLLELFPYVLVLAMILIPIWREPHMSCMILIVIAAASILFVSGIRLYWFLGGGAIVVTVLLAIITRTDYMSSRIQSWLNPSSDPLGDGYQVIQAQTAIGSGGLLGLGLGNGKQKYLFLPEEHNDFIFAVVCEEMGLIGACVIILLFVLLIIRGYWLALHSRDRFGTLLIVGIDTLLAVQVFLNIGVVTGIIPNTGISLPFFSYGGTALLIQLAEMGMILSVSRQIPAPKKEPEESETQ